MQPTTYNVQRTIYGGYIALTAVIIVAVVLLVFTISLASSGFYSRFVVFDAEVKEVSRGLAEGCAETAILRFAQRKDDYVNSFSPTSESIGSYTCDIVSVARIGTDIRIQSRAVFPASNGAVTNLEVEIDGTSYDITSWKECIRFTSGGSCITS